MSDRARKQSAQGYWWKPGADELKLPGTARFDYDEGVEVDLIGAFAQDFDVQSLRSRNTIWGLSVKGKPFTLFDAYQTHHTTHVPGCPTSTLEAFQGVIGGHYHCVNEVVVRCVDVKFRHLTEWCRISGVTQDYDHSSRTQSWKVRAPEAVVLGVWKGITIKILPHIFTQRERDGFSVKEECVLRLEAENPRPWLEFDPVVDSFLRFLSLAVGERSGIIRTEAKTDDQVSELEGRPIWREIDIVRTTSSDEAIRKVDGERMLFTLADIQQSGISIFEQFLECEVVLEPVFDLFFPTYFFNLPPPQELLNMAHAIEAFHRGTIGGQYQSDESYQAGLKAILLKSIPQEIDKDFRSSLERKLDFLHQFSLKRRLKDILRQFESLVVPYTGKRDTFVQVATEARNRLVHATKETPAPDYGRLWEIAQQLGVVLEIAILKEIGFSDDAVASIIRRSKRGSLVRNNVKFE